MTSILTAPSYQPGLPFGPAVTPGQRRTRARRIDLSSSVWQPAPFRTGKNGGQVAVTPDGRSYFVKAPANHQSELGVSVLAGHLDLRNLHLMNTGIAALASETLTLAAPGWAVYDACLRGQGGQFDCLGFSAPLNAELWTRFSLHAGAADPEVLGHDTGGLAYLNAAVHNWDSPFFLPQPINPGNMLFHEGRPVGLDYDEAEFPPLLAGHVSYGDDPDDQSGGEKQDALLQCDLVEKTLRVMVPRHGDAPFARRVRAAAREGFLTALNAHLNLNMQGVCEAFIQGALSEHPADRPGNVGFNALLQPALEQRFSGAR